MDNSNTYEMTDKDREEWIATLDAQLDRLENGEVDIDEYIDGVADAV